MEPVVKRRREHAFGAFRVRGLLLAFCGLAVLPFGCGVGGESCTGTRACTDQLCTSVDGCSLGPGCNGSDPRCNDKSQADCEADELCRWSDVCHGDPPPCESFENDVCESHFGCKVEQKPVVG